MSDRINACVSQRGDRCLHVARGACADRDACAGPAEPKCNRATDAFGGTGHNAQFVVEVHGKKHTSRRDVEEMRRQKTWTGCIRVKAGP
jgi:hypothetical protein